MNVASKAWRRPQPDWTDTQLVRECVKGNEEAWNCLIEKYKNLIYSVPVRGGLSQDESTDIFQEVCMELLHSLPKLRAPQALPAWLLRVTSHKCFHLRHKKKRFPVELTEKEASETAAVSDRQDDLIWQVEQEQAVRETVRALDSRCRELIDMLFFAAPPRPYDEIAEKFGIATGSIGFTRRACLEKMRKLLRRRGVE